jgi:hypothetical protein
MILPVFMKRPVASLDVTFNTARPNLSSVFTRVAAESPKAFKDR